MKDIKTQAKEVTPWQCLQGATISAALAVPLYYLMSAIAQSYANKPINFTNPIIINISIAVRTLVVGLAALGTSVFAIVTFGLIALGIQLVFKKPPQKS